MLDSLEVPPGLATTSTPSSSQPREASPRRCAASGAYLIGGSRLRSRRNNSAFERPKRTPHSVDEHVEVWAEITVADDREVELSSVGERTDADGDVRGEGHDRKDLEQGSAGEVQRDRGAGDVGYVRVHEPLTGHESQKGTLQEHGPEHVSGGWSALLLALGRLCGDRREPSDVVALADGKRHQHPRVDVALRLSRLFPVERDRNEGAEDDTLDGLAAASEQVCVTCGDRRHQDVVHGGAVGVGDVLRHVERAANDREPAVRSDSAVDAGPRGPSLGEDLSRRRP